MCMRGVLNLSVLDDNDHHCRCSAHILDPQLGKINFSYDSYFLQLNNDNSDQQNVASIRFSMCCFSYEKHQRNNPKEGLHFISILCRKWMSEMFLVFTR